MIEVYHKLFVGSQEDYEDLLPNGKDIFVLHAAKEPYHRDYVGYTGKACDKDHPEYLMAIRWNNMAVNLVDAQESKYFNPDLIKEVVKKILYLLINKKTVYIHCNQGESRAPSLALLVLLGLHAVSEDYGVAVKQFKMIYPNYNPGKGISDFLTENWNDYVNYFSTHKEEDVQVAEVEDIKE